MIEAVVCLTTCSNEEEAEKLARALVERRLAACVNLVPGVRSIYRWKGAIETEGEVLLLIKTLRERTAALEKAIGELHSYDVPELVVLPIDSGSPAYLDWIGENVAPKD